MKPNKVMLSKGWGLRNAEAVYAWQAGRLPGQMQSLTQDKEATQCRDGHGYQPLSCGAVAILATVNQGKPTQLL